MPYSGELFISALLASDEAIISCVSLSLAGGVSSVRGLSFIPFDVVLNIPMS